jgi:CheY-like chemotaxis protein
LINEILDISKIEAGKMVVNLTEFDLKHLIDNLSSLFVLRCQQKQLRWTTHEFTGPVLVQGDETKLRQILVNLIGNAIKFTDSGDITLKITPLDNNHYRFDIIDTGSGIPVESQIRIFDAFDQGTDDKHIGGTGLGLAISKKQLELLGSKLFMESKIHEGSNFYFDLHLPPATHEIRKENVNTNSVLHLAPGYQIKALVVDDVKENREVLAKLLADINVDVIEAENGKEGVEKTKEHLPDIVFMDMRMPVMRGEEAIKLIQNEFGRNRIRLVAITASALDRRREHYLEMGFHEYIAKPFREEDIFNCLNQLLEVEFIYESPEPVREESFSTEDLAQCSIPKDLYEQLKVATELYHITHIENILGNLEQEEGTSKQLVKYLRYLASQYNMEEILKVLESVSKG